jgi:hypothetical protein
MPGLMRPVMAAWTKKTVITDPYFKQAKAEGYVSRAAYKLVGGALCAAAATALDLQNGA